MTAETEYTCNICECRVIEGCDGVSYDENTEEWSHKFEPSPYHKHLCKKCLVNARVAMDTVEGIAR